MPRSQKVKRWEWDKLPDYGALSHLTAQVIGTKVDWCIHHRWLRIEYDRDIPLLLHTPKGWERIKELWVRRLLARFEAWQAAGFCLLAHSQTRIQAGLRSENGT